MALPLALAYQAIKRPRGCDCGSSRCRCGGGGRAGSYDDGEYIPASDPYIWGGSAAPMTSRDRDVFVGLVQRVATLEYELHATNLFIINLIREAQRSAEMAVEDGTLVRGGRRGGHAAGLSGGAFSFGGFIKGVLGAAKIAGAALKYVPKVAKFAVDHAGAIASVASVLSAL